MTNLPNAASKTDVFAWMTHRREATRTSYLIPRTYPALRTQDHLEQGGTMRLANKVALITGGGSGIGKASCLLFAREGAKVVVVDLKRQTAEATANDIVRGGGEAKAFAADVSKAKDAEAMIAFAEESYGKLNVVFNNAGVFHPDDESVTTTSEEIWDFVIDVNLKGVFLGSKYAVPALLPAGCGSLINTASFVAVVGAAVPQIAYTASKGGVLAMTREIAVELARKNIRANSLCPGPVETPRLAERLAD